jgi:hypothetical protein
MDWAMERRWQTMEEYERELRRRVSRCRWPVPLAELTQPVLRRIAAAEGIDFATTLLHDRITHSPEHGPFIAQLDSLPVEGDECARLPATVVIVPGAFYIEFPHTGADGSLLRQEAARFGCPSELVPLTSFGSLERNVRILLDWLAGRPDEAIILVSLSKGGAEVKLALAHPGAAWAFRNVVAWINLSGLLQGTPLVSWLLASRWRRAWFRFLFWFRGYDFATIPELARGPGTPLDGALAPPPHTKVIHIVGFPLQGHLSNGLARRCFRRVQDLGPNDGAGIVLADVCRWPGLVYPVWGADHYLRPGGRDLRSLARRLLHYLRKTWTESEKAVGALLAEGAARGCAKRGPTPRDERVASGVSGRESP